MNSANFVKTGPPIRLGWMCPKCERIYAPDVQQCWHCNEAVLDEPAPGFEVTTSNDKVRLWISAVDE